MSRALQKYLDQVILYANRKEKDAAKIRAELEDHLRQKMADLAAQGMSREDAVFQAIEDHGAARTIGYRLRKGFALLDVRTEGTARGFIAIGPRAVGLIAFGNVAVGLLAFGNLAFGVFQTQSFQLLQCHFSDRAFARRCSLKHLIMVHNNRTVFGVARVDFHDGKGVLKRVLECSYAILGEFLHGAAAVRADEMQRLAVVGEKFPQPFRGFGIDQMQLRRWRGVVRCPLRPCETGGDSHRR